MSSINIVVKTNKDTSKMIKANDRKGNMQRICNLLNGLKAGYLRGNVYISASTSDPVAAFGTITVASIANDDTITIGTSTLTAKAAPANQSQFLSAGTDAVVAAAIAACINAHTTLKLAFTATSVGAVVTVTANSRGVLGNHCRLVSSDGTKLAVTGSGYLTGGTGGTSSTLREIGR